MSATRSNSASSPVAIAAKAVKVPMLDEISASSCAASWPIVVERVSMGGASEQHQSEGIFDDGWALVLHISKGQLL